MNNNNTNVLKKIKYISQDAVFELIDNAPIITGNENELPVNEFCRTLWNEEFNSV